MLSRMGWRAISLKLLVMSEMAAAIGSRGVASALKRGLVSLTAWDEPSLNPVADWKSPGCALVKYERPGSGGVAVSIV